MAFQWQVGLFILTLIIVFFLQKKKLGLKSASLTLISNIGFGLILTGGLYSIIGIIVTIIAIILMWTLKT
jgi:hypothetical protein